jgi:hypothetical protein
MREAAATVYAANVSHEVVGAVCRTKLKPFFSDPEASVRAQAATVFHHISNIDTAAQSDLLGTFLASKPAQQAWSRSRALESSQVQLPDLVFPLAELCVETYGTDAGDISKSASASAMGLSKLVVRLYAQTDNSAYPVAMSQHNRRDGTSPLFGVVG